MGFQLTPGGNVNPSPTTTGDIPAAPSPEVSPTGDLVNIFPDTLVTITDEFDFTQIVPVSVNFELFKLVPDNTTVPTNLEPPVGAFPASAPHGYKIIRLPWEASPSGAINVQAPVTEDEHNAQVRHMQLKHMVLPSTEWNALDMAANGLIYVKVLLDISYPDPAVANTYRVIQMALFFSAVWNEITIIGP